MALTGSPDGPPLSGPAAIVGVLDEWARRLGPFAEVDGAALLGERAALAGFSRRGVQSCGGGSRLLAAADGWIALTVARPTDVEALEALLGEPFVTADWHRIAHIVGGQRVGEVRAQAMLLEIPVGVLGERLETDAPLVVHDDAVTRRAVDDLGGLLVVDLSSMWAGPLCGNLLTMAGAQVVKVESSARPDGARFGPQGFFDLLHAGQRSVAIDMRSPADRAALWALMRRADVVIDSSRPRALRQLGLSFDRLRDDGWCGVWLAITAHGLDGVNEMRVGFGDDAAVAGGLVAYHDDVPLFCADAVADPSTGLLGAVAVCEALAAGKGGRIAVSLAATAAHLARHVAETPAFTGRPPHAAAPRARRVVDAAPELGAHTAEVLGR